MVVNMLKKLKLHISITIIKKLIINLINMTTINLPNSHYLTEVLIGQNNENFTIDPNYDSNCICNYCVYDTILVARIIYFAICFIGYIILTYYNVSEIWPKCDKYSWTLFMNINGIVFSALMLLVICGYIFHTYKKNINECFYKIFLIFGGLYYFLNLPLSLVNIFFVYKMKCDIDNKTLCYSIAINSFLQVIFAYILWIDPRRY
jgi:hypothetical protein